METNIIKYIDEAIKLELNVSRLYFKFYELFRDDSEFWWQMSLEEKNHASLLSTLRKAVPIIGKIPDGLLALQTGGLESSNTDILKMIDDFGPDSSRRSAFDIALKIEESAGEIHYQTFVESENLPDEYKVFIHLNHEDRDHARRLTQYMNDNNIR